MLDAAVSGVSFVTGGEQIGSLAVILLGMASLLATSILKIAAESFELPEVMPQEENG